MAESLPQDQTDIHDCSRDAAAAHLEGAEHLVRPVGQHCPRLFVIEIGQDGKEMVVGIARGGDLPPVVRLSSSPASAQLQGGDHRDGLRLAYPSEVLYQVGHAHPPQLAQLYRTLPVVARADQYSHQLGIGKRGDPFQQQFLPRAVFLRPLFDA